MAKATRALAGAIIALFSCALASSAQSSRGQYLPLPPGSVVERQLVAFTGEGIVNRWPAIVSQKLVGSAYGRDFYQWYVSIYQLRRGAYRLRYQSPGNGGPLSRVEQAHGAKMWFPTQDVHLVGVGALMHRGVQQLVVASHETGADCGGATITILTSKPANTVGPVVSIENPCDLDAKIGADGTSVELSGPYYAANAPLCCPTKANVTATLRYRNGKWVESPRYFKLQ